MLKIIKRMKRKGKKLLTAIILSSLILSNVRFVTNVYGAEVDRSNIVIGLDYGHYKGEPGKRSPYDEVFDYQKTEIEYNIGVGRLVEKKLKEKRPDIKIYLTNPNATNKERGNRAIQCKKNNVDILYSIHMNAIGEEWQDKINGCCVCVNKNSTIQTKKMAQDFIDNYSDGTNIKKVASNGIYERGKEVGILNKATELNIPSILIEMDFMDNYESYRNFSDMGYLDMIADVIADSIIDNVDNYNIK